jgi:hypothetical protein
MADPIKKSHFFFYGKLPGDLKTGGRASNETPVSQPPPPVLRAPRVGRMNSFDFSLVEEQDPSVGERPAGFSLFYHFPPAQRQARGVWARAQLRV